MKLFATITSGLALGVLFGASAAEATLRGGGPTNFGVSDFQDEFTFKGWDSDAVAKIQHRNLQAPLPTSYTECISTGYPAVICYCVFINLQPFGYCLECASAFGQSGLDLTKTDQFNNWFDEESVFTVAQTGVYVVSIVGPSCPV